MEKLCKTCCNGMCPLQATKDRPIYACIEYIPGIMVGEIVNRSNKHFKKENEYIKKAEVIKKLCSETAEWYLSPTIKLLREIPAEDVQPVKHGHWYDNTYRYVGELDAYFIQACCSCCNRYSDKLDQYTKIMSNETCSHCGARMDGDTK